MKKDTLLTHVGRDPSRYDGMVNTPVFRTSTVIHPNLESYEKRPPDGEKIVRYGRYGTPTTFAFETAYAVRGDGYGLSDLSDIHRRTHTDRSRRVVIKVLHLVFETGH